MRNDAFERRCADRNEVPHALAVDGRAGAAPVGGDGGAGSGLGWGQRGEHGHRYSRKTIRKGLTELDARQMNPKAPVSSRLRSPGVLAMVAVGGDLEAALTLGADAVQLHEFLHPSLPTRMPRAFDHATTRVNSTDQGLLVRGN